MAERGLEHSRRLRIVSHASYFWSHEHQVCFRFFALPGHAHEGIHDANRILQRVPPGDLKHQRRFQCRWSVQVHQVCPPVDTTEGAIARRELDRTVRRTIRNRPARSRTERTVTSSSISLLGENGSIEGGMTTVCARLIVGGTYECREKMLSGTSARYRRGSSNRAPTRRSSDRRRCDIARLRSIRAR